MKTSCSFVDANSLIAAKVSTRTKTDLIVDGANKLNLITNDGADNLSLAATFDGNENLVAVLPMRLNKDALNDLVVLTENTAAPSILLTAPTEIITVDNSSGGGGGGGGTTLFNAVQTANNTPGLQEIQFNLSGNTLISMTVGLPFITDALTLNGLSQSNGNGEPLVSITTQQLSDTSTLVITGGNSVIRGLILNCADTEGNPVRLFSGNNFIEGNFIGTNTDGLSPGGTMSSGVIISESGNNIGGATMQARNIISGTSGENSHGVHINFGGNNRIRGNYIGTDKAGLAAVSNGGSGVLIETGASGNIVGGETDGERNVISANGFNIIMTTNPGGGVKIKLPTNSFSDVLVENNYIGTNKNGNAALGNLGGGVRLEYAASGTPTAIALIFDNVISGNTGDGVYAANIPDTGELHNAPQTANSFLWVGSRSSGNIAASPAVAGAGNRIGVNAAGTAALPNTGNGVRLEKFPSRIEGNTISANGASGIRVTGAPFSNLIADNFIGTNASGTAALGNADKGIRIEGDSFPMDETQTTKIYDNVISGNTGDGVFASVTTNLLITNAPEGGIQFLIDLARRPPTNFSGAANTNVVGAPGNKIGTNADGTAALPNTANGVNLQNATAKIEGNIISANGANGIKSVLQPSATRFSQIADNYIGTNASGTSDLGNAADGVNLEFNGTAPPTVEASKIWNNVISGNDGNGIRAFSTANVNRNANENAAPQAGAFFFVDIAARRSRNLNANSPEVAPNGNRIGTNAPGTAALGNSRNGVSITNAPTKIGGDTTDDGNIIAHNGANGIVIFSGTNNFIRSNSIFSNTLLDVDLGGDGVTLNDLLDADTGANGLQNYPTLATAGSAGANLQIVGTFNSKPNNPYLLVFYSTANCTGAKSLAAQNQVGATMLTTDANGNAPVNSSFATGVPAGQFITSNAIDLNSAPTAEGNTSEFSLCVAVGQGFEGDVAARPDGDGSILSNDVVQMRRFLNGTNTPDPLTNEFQRADSFPFADKGDGFLDSADIVQTRRYQNGTNLRQIAGGPIMAGGRPEFVPEEVDKLKSSEDELRQMRVENVMTTDGQTVTVNILVNAVGDEAEYAFTLNYDAKVLSKPVIRNGKTTATVRMCNTQVDGAINCSIGGFATNNPMSSESGIGEIGVGENQILITVQFTVTAIAQSGETEIKLSNVNAANDAPQLFTLRTTKVSN